MKTEEQKELERSLNQRVDEMLDHQRQEGFSFSRVVIEMDQAEAREVGRLGYKGLS